MVEPIQNVLLTIREGIRKFQTTNSHREAELSEHLDFQLELLAADQRISQQIERFQKLRASGSEADSELANAIDQLGQCPPGPPTLRARLGQLIIGSLNRILWWKTAENRRLGALVLRVARSQADQLDALAKALGENSRVNGATKDPVRALVSLRSQMTSYQTDLDRRIREIEGVLLDLQSWRTGIASLDGSGGFLRTLDELSRRTETVEHGIQRLDQEGNQCQVKLNDEISHRMQRFEQVVQRLDQENNIVRSSQVDLAARADHARLRLDSIEEKTALLSEIQQEVVEIRARLVAQLQVWEDEISSVARRLADLGLQNQRVRADVSIQDRRLAVFLTEARKRLPEPLDRGQIETLTARQNDILDSLYLAFENIYRGARGEIKERQGVYLPLLRSAGVGTASMPILDLGCGRGEWLELLGGEGWHASGVDANELMVEECRGRGLRVERGDVLDYLQGVPEATLGAVTSFHVVEHLPFDRVMLLIDEALRTLRPGGILILETPNPDNLLVGASTFYLDPTHIRPIPSGTLRFVVEARGFCNVEVWNLHPMPESARLPEDAGGVASRLNELLCGPRDYAIIGRRP
jgi:SAM-dependent methyltransferase